MSIQNAYNYWSEIYDSNKNKTRDLDQIVTTETLSKNRPNGYLLDQKGSLFNDNVRREIMKRLSLPI